MLLTQEETNDDEVDKAFSRGVAGRHDAPKDNGRGQIDGRADASDDDVGGQLHQQIANEENGRGQVEVGSSHVQVLFQSALSGLGEVGSIEEVEQVHDD